MVVTLLAAFVVLPAGAAVGQSAEARGVLLAIDVKTGKVRWRASTPGSFAVNDVSPDTVIGRGFDCTTSRFRTIAFDASGGRRLWERRADRDNRSGGTDRLATGSRRSGVALTLSDVKLTAVAVRTGRARWSTAFAYTPFVSSNSSVVVSSTTEGKYPDDHAIVRAVDRPSGKVLWSVTDDVASRRADAQLDESSVVLTFQTNDGREVDTQVRDPRTGTIRWRTDQNGPYAAGSVVVFSAGRVDPSVHARDARTGTDLWSRPGSAYAIGYGTRLALGDETGVTIVDARTGTELWSVARPQNVVGDAHSLAVTDGHTVTVVDPATGDARRDPITLPTGYEATNSLVLAGDTLYASLGCISSD